jgi:hypothetical protein
MPTFERFKSVSKGPEVGIERPGRPPVTIQIGRNRDGFLDAQIYPPERDDRFVIWALNQRRELVRGIGTGLPVPFDTLGIDDSSTQEEIEEAVRRVIKAWSPY